MTEGTVFHGPAGGEGARKLSEEELDEATAQAIPASGGEGDITQAESAPGSQDGPSPEELQYVPERQAISDAALFERMSNLDKQLRLPPDSYETTPTNEQLDRWGGEALDLINRLAAHSSIAQNQKSAQAANVVLSNLELQLNPSYWVLKHGEVRQTHEDNDETYQTQDLESMFARAAAVAKTKGDSTAQRELAVDTLRQRREAGDTNEPDEEAIAAEVAIIKGQYTQVAAGLGRRIAENGPNELGFDNVHDLMQFNALVKNLGNTIRQSASRPKDSYGHIPLDAAIKALEDRVALSKAIRARGPDYLAEYYRRVQVAQRGIPREGDRQERDNNATNSPDRQERRSRAEYEHMAQNVHNDDEQRKKESSSTKDDEGASNTLEPAAAFTFDQYVQIVSDAAKHGSELSPEQQQDVLHHANDAVEAAKLTAANYWHKLQDLPTDVSAEDSKQAVNDERSASGDMQRLARAQRELAAAYSLGQYSRLRQQIRLADPSGEGSERG